MARGWESKSIEAQLDEAESARQTARKTPLSPDEVEKLRRRELLQLSRARTVQLISQTQNERYRQMLEQELKAIDDKISQLQ